MENSHQKKVLWRIGLGVALLLVLVWGIDLGWHTFQLARVAQQARSLAQSGLQDVSLEQLAGLGEEGYPHLSAIRRDVRPLYPLIYLLQGLPRVGPMVGLVVPALEGGTELAQAGVALIPVLAPIWDDNPSTAETSRLELLVQQIQQNEAQIEDARLAVERAAPFVQRLDPLAAPVDFQDNLAQFKDKFPLLLAGARLLPQVPALLGAEGGRSYLVLGQNNDELRASGGFISAMGAIQMDGGRVADFNLPDSYSVDNPSVSYPDPPEPLQRYMLAGVWMPRDANWSPDFPTTARQAQDLYTLSNGSRVDGVIAFDQTAIQSLVQGLGGVRVSGYSQPLVAANVIFAMRSAWNPGDGEAVDNQWYANRKDFMSDMGKAIMDNLLAMRSPAVAGAVLSGLMDSMQEGHLLVYFNDPVVQAQLVELGLDGGVHPGSGDFVTLVDWNFGFNKVDPLIERSLEYAVDLSDPRQPTATLTLHYLHTLQSPVECRHAAEYGRVYEDLQRRCYWDYWRVYTAPGAELLSAQAPPLDGRYLLDGASWDGSLDVYSGEGEAQVFGGPLLLPAGGQAEIVLHYRLPVGVLGAEGNGLTYHLRLQKQAGLLSLPVTVRVTPPQGYQAEAQHGAWFDDAGTAQWQAVLIMAEEIALRFTPAR